MKTVILTIFFYITVMSNCLKFKNQFRTFDFNFGKFAQTLNSESKIFFN